MVVSANWDTKPVTVSTAQAPPLLFDYDGFGALSYKYKYFALGAPFIGERIRSLLLQARIPAAVDARRGWDQW